MAFSAKYEAIKHIVVISEETIMPLYEVLYRFFALNHLGSKPSSAPLDAIIPAINIQPWSEFKHIKMAKILMIFAAMNLYDGPTIVAHKSAYGAFELINCSYGINLSMVHMPIRYMIKQMIIVVIIARGTV